MKNEYIFPAIFTYEDKGISIEFPDLPGCLPCAENTEKAYCNAKEALALHLYGMEEDKETIPEPTDIRDITLGKNEAIILIDVYMPPYREKIRNQYVKKTLSIPYWLNAEAEARGFNFSGLLQEAIKQQLNNSTQIN